MGSKKGRKKRNFVFFLLYVIFAIYFLNFKFPLLTVPEFILKINDWIVVFGGFLLLFSGLNYLLPRKKRIVY
jgi:cytochrome c biogenesis protein CcdA